MKIPETLSRLGETPLTDPRSVGGSLLFHGLMLALASAAALGMGTLAREPERPRVLQGDLGPVDNRDLPISEGGGEAGTLGADRLAAALDEKPTTGASSSGATASPPAEALISEILSEAKSSDEAVRQVLPGPSTSTPGLMIGPGAGGGGGSGGGAGGGVGRGVGPGTEFFGTRENASSFAYVIDCSGSMATRGSLDVAKRELTNSLSRLPPDAQFAVIFYNLHSTVFSDPKGHRGLMPATAANKGRVGTQLSQVVPDGGTDHMGALRAALALRPEVIFFLTDADLMTGSDASAVIAEAGSTRIQSVEFGRGVEVGGASNPLRRVANSTGGIYRYIDVTQFPRAR